MKIYGHTSTSTDAADALAPPSASAPRCIGAKKHDIGQPDAAHISTSHVEPSNLTMRTFMKRFDAVGAAGSYVLVSSPDSEECMLAAMEGSPCRANLRLSWFSVIPDRVE